MEVYTWTIGKDNLNLDMWGNVSARTGGKNCYKKISPKQGLPGLRSIKLTRLAVNYGVA